MEKLRGAFITVTVMHRSDFNFQFSKNLPRG